MRGSHTTTVSNDCPPSSDVFFTAWSRAPRAHLSRVYVKPFCGCGSHTVCAFIFRALHTHTHIHIGWSYGVCGVCAWHKPNAGSASAATHLLLAHVWMMWAAGWFWGWWWSWVASPGAAPRAVCSVPGCDDAVYTPPTIHPTTPTRDVQAITQGFVKCQIFTMLQICIYIYHWIADIIKKKIICIC